MRTLWIGLAVLAASCVGCEHRTQPPFTDERTAHNRWMVQAYGEASVRKGIIRQRTLFPHHFVSDAATLNELGDRDVSVLAAHLKQSGGTINVHRGEADEALYEQRLETVQQAFVAAGVGADQVAIVDDFPGGEGLPSDRVVEILGTPAHIPSYPASSGLERPEVQQ